MHQDKTRNIVLKAGTRNSGLVHKHKLLVALFSSRVVCLLPFPTCPISFFPLQTFSYKRFILPNSYFLISFSLIKTISLQSNPPVIVSMGFKPFLEGGIAAIIAGALTHPLDLIKVRMQLQGEHSVSLDQNPNPNLVLNHNILPVKPYRPVFALDSLIGSISLLPSSIHAPSSSTRSVMTPFAVGAHIVKTEGPAALFSGVSATILRQMLYSATRMGIYDFLKRRWTDRLTGNNTKIPLVTIKLK